MTHLRTDWLCVATEGDTVDGRVLEKQWLIDAAETYNPDLYGALIWPEHCKNYGNFGEVLAVMYQEGDDGLVRLYVQLRPNAYLLEANKRDQMIYFSVELTENGDFRGTGRAYLEGLAVTDTPASVGTTRLRFSKRNKFKPGYYACTVAKTGNIKQVKKMTNWQSWFGIQPKKFAEGDPEETLSGDDDKLQVLANALNDLEGRVSAIESQQSETQSAVEDVQEDIEVVKEVVDTEDFKILRDNVSAVVKNFAKLDKKITTLPNRNFADKRSQKEKRFKFL